MAGVYVPRSPTTGVLYGVVRMHLTEILAAVDAQTDGSGLPRFVVNEFRKFLRCGVLAHRFALYGERLYRLIYRIGGDAVFVLALFDGRRELEDVLLDRLVRSP